MSALVTRSSHEPLLAGEQVTLVDLLDRVLAKGVVVTGELTLTVADVDLVHISLRALLSAVRPDLFRGLPGPEEEDREHHETA